MLDESSITDAASSDASVDWSPARFKGHEPLPDGWTRISELEAIKLLWDKVQTMEGEIDQLRYRLEICESFVDGCPFP